MPSLRDIGEKVTNVILFGHHRIAPFLILVHLHARKLKKMIGRIVGDKTTSKGSYVYSKTHTIRVRPRRGRIDEILILTINIRPVGSKQAIKKTV
ncbi:MAG: hypothetical protein LBN74_01550 [Prevotella sp.]|nr:hypothetical protein [Prevotella sp.]